MADVIKTVDELKISKAKRDLTTFCKLVNDFAEVMKRNDFIEELTPEICEQLVNMDLTQYKQNIINQYAEQAEANGHTIMRKQYKSLAGKMLIEVDKVFNMFLQDVELAKRTMDLNLMEYERIPFVKVEEGKATFNEAQVERQYSHVYNSRDERLFVEYVRKMHADIIEFNRIVRTMGGAGIQDSPYSLITVDALGVSDEINWSVLDNLKF